MSRILFYHLTEGSVEDTLAQLLPMAVSRGMRVDLRGRDAERLAVLDERLWGGAEEGFLPHGLAGGPHDDRQPVLLTTAVTLRPGVSALMSIDAAEVDPGEVAGLERVWILFDGSDETAVSAARAQWRQLSAAGVVLDYWTQQDGRWQRRMTTETQPD